MTAVIKTKYLLKPSKQTKKNRHATVVLQAGAFLIEAEKL